MVDLMPCTSISFTICRHNAHRLATSLAFSKRVMSQLASAGSNRAAVMRPTLTRQQNLRKEYIYQPGFRAKTDACLTPICERHASRA